MKLHTHTYNTHLIPPPHPHTDTLNTELKEKVKRMLCEYDTMLKSQSSRLTQLDGEREELHSHNTELQARNRELELKLERATSARDGLKGRMEELSAALEGV